MNVKPATLDDEKTVLELLDEFRAVAAELTNPGTKTEPDAVQKGGPMFREAIESDRSAIFIAFNDNEEVVGIVTGHKFPQIRKGQSICEVEEMFVQPSAQGSGAAKLLIDAIEEWAKQENLTAVRLESSDTLKRAHGFYEKAGFDNYGRAFIKKL